MDEARHALQDHYGNKACYAVEEFIHGLWPFLNFALIYFLCLLSRRENLILTAFGIFIRNVSCQPVSFSPLVALAKIQQANLLGN